MRDQKRNKVERKSKTIKKFSAGGVVFREQAGIHEILLLKTTTADEKKEIWVLPKGGIEAGEGIEEAALREIEEETGLGNIKLNGKIGQEQYFYKETWNKGQLVFKKVYYFLYEFLGKEEPQPQAEEGFTGAGWFLPEEASELIAYKESKAILEKALRMLEK